jgi:hypothetical protein
MHVKSLSIVSTKNIYDVWWTMHGEDFLKALQRAATGEDPELVYLEFYVNSEGETHTDGIWE